MVSLRNRGSASSSLLLPHTHSIAVKNNIISPSTLVPLYVSSKDEKLNTAKERSSLNKRWMTGLSLAVLGSLWIGSNKHLFFAGMILQYLLAEKEFSAMIKADDPEAISYSKPSIFLSIFTYYIATYYPSNHNNFYPVSIVLFLAWLLINGRPGIKLKHISITSFSILYLAFMPSFWIRMHNFFNITKLIEFNPMHWAIGQKLMWWTVTSIVMSGTILETFF